MYGDYARNGIPADILYPPTVFKSVLRSTTNDSPSTNSFPPPVPTKEIRYLASTIKRLSTEHKRLQKLHWSDDDGLAGGGRGGAAFDAGEERGSVF